MREESAEGAAKKLQEDIGEGLEGLFPGDDLVERRRIAGTRGHLGPGGGMVVVVLVVVGVGLIWPEEPRPLRLVKNALLGGVSSEDVDKLIRSGGPGRVSVSSRYPPPQLQGSV